MSVKNDIEHFFSDVIVPLFWLALVSAPVAGMLYFCFWRERPYVLIRFTAARAIEATAEFQHKTKFYFEVAQAEGAIPGACHNFEFSPDEISTFKHYLATGAMEFFHYGNQSPPFHPVSAGSLALSDKQFLVDNIERCRSREVKETTGSYELTLGKAVIEVTGIRKEGNRASVEFLWHFETLNKIGRALSAIQIAKEAQTTDERTTREEKARAPSWLGTAELTKYDDGWKVLNVKFLESPSWPWTRWEYGPEEWPDPYFNWHTFDESENR
jgi:hypothetical protein